jgi:hypothetical protein
MRPASPPPATQSIGLLSLTALDGGEQTGHERRQASSSTLVEGTHIHLPELQLQRANAIRTRMPNRSLLSFFLHRFLFWLA